MGIEEIKKLCEDLNGIKDGKINIHGDIYDAREVIDFARATEPRVITLKDALKVIQRMDLFQELQRVVRDKDTGLVYKITGEQE